MNARGVGSPLNKAFLPLWDRFPSRSGGLDRPSHRFSNALLGGPTDCTVPAGWRHRFHTVLLALVLALSPSADAGEPGTSPAPAAPVVPELRAAAGRHVVWLLHRRVEPDGQALWRFAYLLDGQPGARRFAPLPLGPVAGTVAYIAAVGTSLHVFYADGTHKRYRGVALGLTGSAGPTVFDERTLPGSVLPFAVGVDTARGVLLAVVDLSVLASIEQALATEMQLDEQAVVPDQEHTDAATAWAPPLRSATRAIVRYDRGRWLPERVAPPDVSEEVQLLALFGAEGALHLVYRPATRKAAVVDRLSTASGGWAPPVELPLEGGSEHIVGHVSDAGPILAAVEPTPRGRRITTLRFADGAWTRLAELLDEGGDPLRLQPPLAAAWSGDELAVATLGAGGDPQVGFWSADTGQPVAGPATVQVLARSRTDPFAARPTWWFTS